jgi:predicted dehydrogenase
MIQIALFGYGRWGPNLARCVAANPDTALTAICDIAAERLIVAGTDHPNARLESDPHRLINDPGIDGVVLATPATTHYEIARAALRAGKHVLVEKPIALASEHVLRLIDEADRQRLVLMIDHTYVFSPPVRAIVRAVQTGALGAIRSMESLRVNPDGGHDDVSVVWDLAYHDVSLIDHIFGGTPRGISATGYAAHPGGLEYRAELAFNLPGGIIANIHVDRSGPAKIRRIVVVGSERTLTFDDLEPTAKIRIRASEPSPVQASVRMSEMSLPAFEQGEPLQAVVEHFAACIRSGTRPLSDGAAGLRIVRLLEVASRSISNAGRMIPLAVDEVS